LFTYDSQGKVIRVWRRKNITKHKNTLLQTATKIPYLKEVFQHNFIMALLS
jgi:hypothetical protein